MDQLGRDDSRESRELETLLDLGPSAPDLLEQEAGELRRRADLLARVAEEVRLQQALRDLEELIAAEDFDLLRGALLLARLDDGDLDVEAYLREVERMAGDIRERLAEDASSAERFAALNRYLFEENGYHGSRHDYYHPANSYLNRVIDDREGIPITLAILYLELGTRLGLDLEGVGLPGHFVVRWRESEEAEQLVDVFENARLLDRDEAARIVRNHAGEALGDEHLRAVSQREIMRRMLGNLVGIAQRDRRSPALRRYLEAIVRVDPESTQYRGMRAIARFETGHRQAALEDLDWFFENQPPGIDMDRIRELRQLFERQR